MRVTKEILEQGKSANGAWSAKQLELFGESWPPFRGWKYRILEQDVSAETIEKFVALKDAHLTELPMSRVVEKANKFLFNYGQPPSAEARKECPFELMPDKFYIEGAKITEPESVIDYLIDTCVTGL